MPDVADPLFQSSIAVATATLLLYGLFIIGPNQNLPKILATLGQDPKPFDELRKTLSENPHDLRSKLEFMENELGYIVRVWRGPWDKNGAKQDPWIYDLTPIGLRALNHPLCYRQDFS